MGNIAKKFIEKYLLRISALVILSLHSFIFIRNRFFPTFLCELWPKDPFEIEIWGSVIFALMISLILNQINKNSDFSKNRNAIKNYFESIIKQDLRNSFKRFTKNLNTTTASNHKFYFDNSHVNNLYDVIQKHINHIYKHTEYSKPETITKLLIDFYQNTNDAYIKCEALDVLLIHYAKMKKIPDESENSNDLKNKVIYYKAIKIAEFSEDQVENEFYNKVGLGNLFSFLKSPSDENEISLKNGIDELTKKIIYDRKSLIKMANDIFKLVESRNPL